MSVTTERFTLDTNILIYSIDSAAGERHALAAEIVDRAAECECWLTLQALSEFYAAVTRKGLVPPADAAAQASDWLEIFPSAAASATALRTALGDATAGRASFWDALLLATAAEAGCTTILSEDMAGGTRIGGIAILNPFAARGLAEPVRRLLGQR
ncbi:MAG TPA: PIN domain-containing protein [Alphaproteobacteria bacterium]|nr:PIN domain-containing protein [Alphaproteobacteria bacterium]